MLGAILPVLDVIDVKGAPVLVAVRDTYTAHHGLWAVDEFTGAVFENSTGGSIAPHRCVLAQEDDGGDQVNGGGGHSERYHDQDAGELAQLGGRGFSLVQVLGAHLGEYGVYNLFNGQLAI
jgi:hypothetical protein